MITILKSHPKKNFRIDAETKRKDIKNLQKNERKKHFFIPLDTNLATCKKICTFARNSIKIQIQ